MCVHVYTHKLKLNNLEKVVKHANMQVLPLPLNKGPKLQAAIDSVVEVDL